MADCRFGALALTAFFLGSGSVALAAESDDGLTGIAVTNIESEGDASAQPEQAPEGNETSDVPANSRAGPAPRVAPKPDPLRVVWSQFSDLPIIGDAEETVRYGGKIDAYINVPGGEFGLDDSFLLRIHPELRYGTSANTRIGLLPSNTQMYYPEPGDLDETVFDLSATLTKQFRSGASLTVGKLNSLDPAALVPVSGGGGIEGFQNLGLALPPTAIVPASVTGAMLIYPTEDVIVRWWVYDPEVQSRKTGFESLFSEGVSSIASVTFPTKIGGQQGYYAVKVMGTTRDGPALDLLPPVLQPGPGSAWGNEGGGYAAMFAFQQFLTTIEGAPGRGTGIFGHVAVSDGDPTFLDWSAVFGLQGSPAKRPQDRFGIAWFRYSLAEGLVDELATRVPLEDEEGVEAFYTYGISKRFRLTASVQVVDSAVVPRDVGTLASLRLVSIF